MHFLELNWAQVRGREGKGAEVADAAGLPVMAPDLAITRLTAPEALRLKAELEARVAEKKRRQAQQAANKAKKDAEEVGAAS